MIAAMEVQGVIGAPYVPGGGVGSYDCWTLFCRFANAPEVWRDPLASMEDIASRLVEATNRNAWSRTESPEDGDAVLCSQASRMHHIGIWYDGRVLHADRPSVRLESLDDMKMRGYRRFEFWRWAGE